MDSFFAKISKGCWREVLGRLVGNNDGSLLRVTADGKPNDQIIETNESKTNSSFVSWPKPLKPIGSGKTEKWHHWCLHAGLLSI